MMNKQIIKKENLKYVWLAVFVIMVCTVITCQDNDSSKSTMKVAAPIQEIVKEKIEEVKVQVEEKVEVGKADPETGAQEVRIRKSYEYELNKEREIELITIWN